MENKNDLPQDLPPIEEYLQTMDRIISSNKLSPRKMQILKEIMSRYEPCQEHKSTMCNILACRQSRIPESSKLLTTKKCDKGNSNKSNRSLIGVEMFQTAVEDISKSLDNETSSNEIRETSIQKSISDPQYEEQKWKESDSVLTKVSFISRTPKTSLDTIQRENIDIQQIQTSAKSDFDYLLKDSCNLESFMIDNPFSDFSLWNMEQDKVLQKHDRVKGILEQSKLPFYEVESSSKSIIRDPYRKYEKSSVRFADESTKEKIDIPLPQEETEIPEEETIENQKICKCQ